VINDNYYKNLLVDMDLMNKDLDNLLEDKDRIVVVVELLAEEAEVLHLVFV
jgi:hypothetical protein